MNSGTNADQEFKLLAERFGFFPCKADKKPNVRMAGDHNRFRHGARPTHAECEQWVGGMIGLWAGENGVGVIDIDDDSLYEPFLQAVTNHGLEPVLDRCAIGKTPHGHHIYCLVAQIEEGSQKLACWASPRHCPARDKDVTVRIETRAVGGYAIVPPSPGYTYVRGSLLTLETITLEEWRDLCSLARLFDERQVPAAEPARSAGNGNGQRPGDDYNERGPLALELLLDHGWQQVGRSTGGRITVRRPGKTTGGPSGTVTSDGQLFYCFSTNAEPFESECAYSAFGVLTMLEHGGDFKAAAKALASQGYGGRVEGSAPSPIVEYLLEQEDVSEGTPLKEYARTDLGNAERLADRLRGKALWCHPWKCWMVWDGKRWLRDERAGEQIYQTAFQILKAAALRAQTKESLSWELKSQDRKNITNMIELSKQCGDMAALPQEFDRDDWLLNVPNGTIDLRTGELRPHRREDRITRIGNVPFEPDAPFDEWHRFLDRVTDGSRDLQLFLARAAGYSLTGSTSEQCLMFLYGSGLNGKSTFMELITHVLGDYAMHTPTETLMMKRDSGIPNDLARLKGARLVAATETEAGKRLAESLIKQLTGGDPITARYLHAEYFTFRPTFKLWLSGNHKPTIRGADEGIWRRMRLVPFEVRIPDHEVDPDLGDKLKEHAVGILSWMVAGCLDWQRNRLPIPAKVKDATGLYREDMDTIGNFLEECVVGQRDAFLTSADLYRTYRAWCDGNGERPESQKALSQQMIARGHPATKNSRGIRGFMGLRLSDSISNSSWGAPHVASA